MILSISYSTLFFKTASLEKNGLEESSHMGISGVTIYPAWNRIVINYIELIFYGSQRRIGLHFQGEFFMRFPNHILLFLWDHQRKISVVLSIHWPQNHLNVTEGMSFYVLLALYMIINWFHSSNLTFLNWQSVTLLGNKA